MIRAIYFILIFCGSSASVFAQCACMGGAAVGGLTPIGGTANVGVMREGFARISTYYRFAAGSTTLSGIRQVEDGPVTEYATHFLGLSLGYGVSNSLTVETELGYFPNKFQNFAVYSIEGSGLSHISVGAKYNLWNDIANEWEATIGAGGRIPLTQSGLNLPQHLLPSSGAYGGHIQGFLHKGWREHGVMLILLNRSDVHAVNSLDYHYGASFSSSVMAGKTLTPILISLLELRHELRLKDTYLDADIESSGGNVLTISPQLNLLLGEVNVSFILDYPFYRNYYGTQLANDYALALNFTWQPQLFGD